jgi:transposase
MFVAVIPNRSSPPAILLRESYREDGKVKSRTLANLSKLPPEAIDALRKILKGQKLVPAGQSVEVTTSLHHGHVQAVLETMRRLGFAKLVASKSSRERDLVVAMVAARILLPESKLATTRAWEITTLPSSLGVSDADEDDLYEAMDWLLDHQRYIEKKLAARHLEEGCLGLYDLTSSYFEGLTCPLAKRGHNRDGKKGKLQVNYGLLTDARGCPVSVSVFEGNTGDPETLLAQVDKARNQFGLQKLVLVGDRGMITQRQVEGLRDIENLDWITALRPGAIRKLVQDGAVQLGLFDERNLFELTHPDFPGERLVACRNPPLARRRAEKRKDLLAATVRELEKVQRMVERDRVRGQHEIAKRIQAILSGYRIGKHYRFEVRDDGFDVDVDRDQILAQADTADRESTEVIEKRRARLQRHFDAIEQRLEKLRSRIERGRLAGKQNIGLRVGKVLNKYRVGKHFQLDILDAHFSFEIDQEKVVAEAALDGIYVIRTSVPEERLTAEDAVRNYKLLGQVERAFRTFKGLDLQVRPIRHRLENRVRAHIFLCMLAYYVQWHMMQAWRPLLFADEDQAAKKTRDPVAPAKRSASAKKKVRSKKLEDGSKVHSFRSLLTLLSGIVRNVCRIEGAGSKAPAFEITTTPNEKQQQALDLLQNISV